MGIRGGVAVGELIDPLEMPVRGDVRRAAHRACTVVVVTADFDGVAEGCSADGALDVVVPALPPDPPDPPDPARGFVVGCST